MVFDHTHQPRVNYLRLGRVVQRGTSQEYSAGYFPSMPGRPAVSVRNYTKQGRVRCMEPGSLTPSEEGALRIRPVTDACTFAAGISSRGGSIGPDEFLGGSPRFAAESRAESAGGLITDREGSLSD